MMLHAEPQSNIKDRIRLHYYLRDHLGNTVVAFDDRNYDGAISDVEEGTQIEVIGRYHYYSFGMQWNHAWVGSDIGGYWQQRYRYNGKEMHSNSGLLDYGFRYYRVSAEGRDDPSVGRFMGVDPLAEAAPNLTPYRYGFNNPISFIDPDGLYETEKQANKARSKVEKDLGADNVGSVTFDEDRKEYGFKVFKETRGEVQDGVTTIVGDKGTSVFNKKDIHGFKSANGLHKASYWSFSASFVFAGGGSFSVGKVSDKYGESAWFSTIGGGVGLELGVGFDAGGIVEHGKDFRVADFQGQGIDYGAGIGPLGFRIGGNDPNQKRLLHQGTTYTTIAGSGENKVPKALNAIKFKLGGSFLWNETFVH